MHWYILVHVFKITSMDSGNNISLCASLFKSYLLQSKKVIPIKLGATDKSKDTKTES